MMEFRMPTISELERESPTELAVLCQRVADHPSNYSQPVAEAAFKLKLEWTSLAGARHFSLKEQTENEAQMKSLHRRMAEFLAGTL
jgi:hypothetical protein